MENITNALIMPQYQKVLGLFSDHSFQASRRWASLLAPGRAHLEAQRE